MSPSRVAVIALLAAVALAANKPPVFPQSFTVDETDTVAIYQARIRVARTARAALSRSWLPRRVTTR